jgi:putative aldouronate transport system permease protein
VNVPISRRALSEKAVRRQKTWFYFRNHYILYLMLVPVIAYYIIFHYVPMGGLVIAFKDYNMFRGMLASEWVGLDNFKEIFRLPEFFRSIRNTLVLNVLSLVLGFPAPIILALMLNELKTNLFKKAVQTLLYLPHFISWVVVGGMMYQIFSSTTGMVNQAIKAISGSTIPFLTNPGWWIATYFVVSVWHGIGWGAIIYLSAITGVDAEIYEAAKVDGCGRIRTIFSITLPNIMGTVMIMLILRIGGIASIGFEQPLSLSNDTVREVGDVISTYVYRIGIQNNRFSISTAVGLFQSVINFILVVAANQTSKKLTEQSIW